MPTDDQFRSVAHERYVCGSDGDIDMDENAVVSQSDEGAYVAAWIWVSNEAAEEIPE